jgi:hypothetical protein
MMARIFRGAGAWLIAVVQALTVGAMLALPVTASQSVLYNPTSGTLPGLTMVQNYNAAIDAVASCNSGGSPPTNQFLSLAPSLGNCWLNTTNNSLNIFDGSNWNTVAWVDAVNHVIIGQVGGGGQSVVASAATSNLCGISQATVRGSNVLLSGTTTITSFGSNCFLGQVKFLTFGAALTLTYNATSMILPTGASITTATGDTAMAIYLGSGNWQILFYQPATGAALSTAGLNVGAAALGASALASFQQPVNLQIYTSGAPGPLTVTIKGVNGADPSPTNPVLVGFRSQTLQPNSTNVFGALTGALNVTLSSTSSMGCTTGVACRLWVTLICQTETSATCNSSGGNGTSSPILLGLSNQSTPSQVYPLSEDVLQSTGLGASNGTSVGVIQTSVASLSGKAIRIIGFIEATWLSSTGWSAPTKVQLFGPGVHKPGEVVQTVFAQTGTNASAGSTFAASNVAVGITPTSGINIIEVSLSGNCNTGPGATITATVRRGTSTSVGQSEQVGISGSGSSSLAIDGVVAFDFLDVPPSAATYTIYFNSSAGTSVITGGHALAREIMGALDEPGNDNFSPRARAAKRDYARNRASQPAGTRHSMFG